MLCAIIVRFKYSNFFHHVLAYSKFSDAMLTPTIGIDMLKKAISAMNIPILMKNTTITTAKNNRIRIGTPKSVEHNEEQKEMISGFEQGNFCK